MNKKEYLPEMSYVGQTRAKSLFSNTIALLCSAIDEVAESFEVKEPIFPPRVAAVGARGSGKTTVLRAAKEALGQNPYYYVLDSIIDPSVLRENKSLLQVIIALLFSSFQKHAAEDVFFKKQDLLNQRDQLLRQFEKVNRLVYYETSLEPDSGYEDSAFSLADFAGLFTLESKIGDLVRGFLDLVNAVEKAGDSKNLRSISKKDIVIFVDDFDLCPHNLPLAIKQIISYLEVDHLILVFAYDKESLQAIIDYKSAHAFDPVTNQSLQQDIDHLRENIASSYMEKFVPSVREIPVRVNADHSFYRKALPSLLVGDAEGRYSATQSAKEFFADILGNPNSIRRANSTINIQIRDGLILSEGGIRPSFRFSSKATPRIIAGLIQDIYQLNLGESELQRGWNPVSLSEMLYWPLTARKTRKMREGVQIALCKAWLYLNRHHRPADIRRLQIEKYEDILIVSPSFSHEEGKLEIRVARFSGLNVTLSPFLFYIMSVARNVFTGGDTDFGVQYYNLIRDSGLCPMWMPADPDYGSVFAEIDVQFTQYFYSDEFNTSIDLIRRFVPATKHGIQSDRSSSADYLAFKRGLLSILNGPFSYWLFGSDNAKKKLKELLMSDKDGSSFLGTENRESFALVSGLVDAVARARKQ